MTAHSSPLRKRTTFYVASLVFGVSVFAVIGSDGYFSDPDTQVFAAIVALISWAAGVFLMRRYIFNGLLQVRRKRQGNES